MKGDVLLLFKTLSLSQMNSFLLKNIKQIVLLDLFLFKHNNCHIYPLVRKMSKRNLRTNDSVLYLSVSLSRKNKRENPHDSCFLYGHLPQGKTAKASLTNMIYKALANIKRQAVKFFGLKVI